MNHYQTNDCHQLFQQFTNDVMVVLMVGSVAWAHLHYMNIAWRSQHRFTAAWCLLAYSFTPFWTLVLRDKIPVHVYASWPVATLVIAATGWIIFGTLDGAARDGRRIIYGTCIVVAFLADVMERAMLKIATTQGRRLRFRKVRRKR